MGRSVEALLVSLLALHRASDYLPGFSCTISYLPVRQSKKCQGYAGVKVGGGVKLPAQ